MEYKTKPAIRINKLKTPVIYLDTLVMIELARFEKGICTDVHLQEIKELYELLKEAMQEKRIICPLGNQLREMGISKGREYGREFLFRFTNSKLFLPGEIENMELDEGYSAFVDGRDEIVFDSIKFFASDHDATSQFIVCVAPIIKKDELSGLRETKIHIADILNGMKEKGAVEQGYEEQLDRELEAHYQLFRTALQARYDSEEAFCHFLEMIGPIYSRIGLPGNKSVREQLDDLNKYSTFLKSSYHHKLPYAWIQAVLWAHRMQRINKINHGDNLDTLWTAAYLPFVDYVVTDKDLCKLVKDSGLADLYETKVYSLRTLEALLQELRAWKSKCTEKKDYRNNLTI